MAGFIQRVGAAYAAPTPSVLVVPVTNAVTQGGSLLVAVAFGNQAGSVLSVTDTRGGYYVLDLAANVVTTSGRGLEIWRCAQARSLTTSDTIRITVSATQDHGIAAIVDLFSFLAAPDITASHYDGTTTTTPAVTFTATAADVIAYAACNDNGKDSTFTVASPFTATGAALLAGSNPGTSELAAYVNAPGAGSVTATFTTSDSHTAVTNGLGYPGALGTAPAQPPATVVRRHARQRSRAKVGPGTGPAGGVQPFVLPLTGPVIPVTATAIPGTVSGNLSIVQQVNGTSTYDYGWSTVQMATTAGNTLIVLVGWDLSVNPTAAAMPAVYVTDSAGNYWRHAGTSSSSVTGSRSAAWICPNARPVSWVSVSLTTFASSLAYTVLEITNMPAGYSLDVEGDNGSPSASSLDISAGTTSAAGIAFSVFTTGAAPLSPATPAGWTALTPVTSGAGSANPVQMFPYWSPAAAGASLSTTYSLTQAVPVSGVTFSVLASPPAPVQQNANFPILKVEAAFGFTPGDPSQAPPAWTDITIRCLTKSGDAWITSAMGRQYELAQMEAGELTIMINNQDGAFTPGNAASPYYPNVVLGVPIHVSAYWAGHWYHVGFGYVERWPQQWPDLPQWGMSEMVATDVIAAASSAQMVSALDGDMLLDAPYAFIPCSEQYTTLIGGLNPVLLPADAQGLLAANASRVNQRAAFYADGTAATAGTGQEAGLLGDSDTGFGTSSISTAPTAPASGPGVIYTDPALPDPVTGDGVTVEFWVVIPATVAATSLQPVVFSAYGPASNYQAVRPSLQVLISNFGGSVLTVTLADGSTVTAPFNVSANAQQIVLTVTSSSLQVYVNGGLAATASLSAAQVSAWNAVTLGCPNYAYQAGSLTAGNFTAFDLAVYPYLLPVQRILSHYVTGFSGQQNCDASQRIAQILSWANLGVPRAGQVLFSGASDGVTQGPAYGLEGASAASGVNQVVLNHVALAAGAPSGALVYWHRWALYNQAPVATFGDDLVAADGEVPYLPGLTWDYDNTYLSNIVQVTQQVGPNTTVTVTAADFASQHAYFTRSALQQTISTMSDLDAYGQANFQIAKYSQPQLRVSGVTVDAASNAAVAFPVLLALQQGQAATVTRRPLGGAVISESVLTQKIEHSVGPGRWQTSMQLSPYTPENSILQLSSPGFDALGNGTLG